MSLPCRLIFVFRCPKSAQRVAKYFLLLKCFQVVFTCPYICLFAYCPRSNYTKSRRHNRKSLFFLIPVRFTPGPHIKISAPSNEGACVKHFPTFTCLFIIFNPVSVGMLKPSLLQISAATSLCC